MSLLDTLIPSPRLMEVNSTVLHASARAVWQHLRHEELAESLAIRALFRLRTYPAAKQGKSNGSILRIDELRSTPDEPGFQLLGEESERSLTVGAIGKVWQLEIPFSHVASAAEYCAFDAPDWIKVAWEIRLSQLDTQSTQLEFEVRVDATDAAAWSKFERYWLLVGPGSHFIRRVLLSELEKRFSEEKAHEQRPLPGDELLPAAGAQLTHHVTIGAKPAEVWPWLVQMGCDRAGFYAIDVLDNGGVPSAREIHPELQSLRVGEILPATPGGSDGFEVLRLEAERVLVLGGLYDAEAERQLPFHGACPKDYWHVTWSFVLEPGDADTTTLWVRARACFSPSERFHVQWIRPVHHLMQETQLRHLKQRAEGKVARDSLRDVASGMTGVAIMAFSFLTPFLRSSRNHWGLSLEEANREYLGDECISDPAWMWTHAVDIEAPAQTVWPWVAQMGADRGGFYSYQWLENLAGCELKNAEALHPEFTLRVGDNLSLHPQMPPLPIVRVEPGHCWVAFAAADPQDVALGRRWAAVSWAFFVEPLAPARCRVVSRFRSSCSKDLATQLSMGPWVLEPIGFAMDRRALLGIRERVELFTSNESQRQARNRRSARPEEPTHLHGAAHAQRRR